MGIATDTILFGIAILIIYATARLPVDEGSGVIGILGGVVVLVGYVGSLYTSLATSSE